MQRTNRFTCNAIVIGLVLLMSSARAASAGFFLGVGDLPGGAFSSVAEGISPDGTVAVGNSDASGGSEAFRWTSGGGIVALPGSATAFAVDTSWGGGVSVGQVHSGGSPRAVAWQGVAAPTILPNLSLSDVEAQANGVSDDGTIIVGGTVTTPNLAGRAARWTFDGSAWHVTELVPLAGTQAAQAFAVSADGSIAVGFNNVPSDPRIEAVRWTNPTTPEGLGDLAGGALHSLALGISADGGTIVGVGTTAAGQEAFRWTSSFFMEGLGVPTGFTSSLAQAASGDGAIIVGLAQGGPDGNRGFLWTQATGPITIEDYFISMGLGPDIAQWTLARVTDVSSDGLTFVGVGVDPLGQQQGWVARVPESSSLLLLGATAGGVGLRYRWRKRGSGVAVR